MLEAEDHWDQPFLHEAFHTHHQGDLVIRFNKDTHTFQQRANTTSTVRMPREQVRQVEHHCVSAHDRSSADHTNTARPRFRWSPRTCATKQSSVGTPPATCSSCCGSFMRDEGTDRCGGDFNMGFIGALMAE